MFNLNVLICIEDERFSNQLLNLQNLVDEAKDKTLQCVLNEVDFLDQKKDFILNLCLSDNETIHRLNKEFRGIDKPTNVLSFANIDDPFFKNILKENPVELGDIMMAYETIKKEAEETNVSFKDHFCHLFVHGLLHILGYDHIKEDERLRMEKKEIEILKQMNIENPYEE